ncbi:GNAT family N-acetyltransferase [Mycoplasmopsis synoviae]|uniref:GNAT family N-acetyltransferase n=1 Tax=Mycoplasmopsis synoviae TaxID=2109 RepID=A0AAQ2TBW2_MYCSY|nr:GNAT family N-acetyltransferase [Mycoplasmopsis synoviae]AKJ20592.1 Protein export cytoplasm protein SecA ATPase RNAhelicase [Mycoplasmopsis synoviae]AQU47912.1 Protein export cytoplasm protein SecA ATPase RNAhelicase [Mycoplasmopsis synoviae]UZF64006.1 GNAT family N-acetyltransferase [Mycoplasmopsis synoviae]UZF64677.1 GNAT family N-acetyltransferase [Mycoplasmopsis synoviae]UZF65348.1 GNAT family N-acetyltransferase [Mycoplasmopsis synoviae]
MLTFTKYNDKNKNKIINYLYDKSDELNNTFLISDLENFKLDDQNIILYVGKQNKQIYQIFLVFYDNLVLYSQNQFLDLKMLRKLHLNHKIKNFIYGQNLIDPIDKYFLEHKISNSILKQELYKLDQNYFEQKYKDFITTSQQFVLDDIKAIINSRKQIKEFSELAESNFNLELQKENFLNHSYYGFIIKEANTVIAHAGTSAITNNTCTIGGVYTLENHRQKGLALDCLVNLIRKSIQDQKLPILFFSSSDAKKLYIKLGFVPHSNIFVAIIK